MSTTDRSALADAVDLLITDDAAETLYAQMQGIIELTERQIPARLTGRPGMLNPLLDLYVEDHAAYERVIDLINRKRVDRGLAELGTEDEPDRKAYMREFMAQKREKQATLVKLWNELRSDNDKIKGPRRIEFEREHAARWQDEKKRREDAARAKLGRRLSEPERKAITAKLWDDVQGELDALDSFVRSEVRKPLHMRAPNGFQFKVGVLKKD